MPKKYKVLQGPKTVAASQSEKGCGSVSAFGSPLSEDEKRIAIAKACGWEILPEKDWLYRRVGEEEPSGKLPGYKFPTIIPDYESDLAAMHEAEKVLTDEQWATYYNALYFIVVAASPEGSKNILRGAVCATAAQRAEAFLSVVNRLAE